MTSPPSRLRRALVVAGIALGVLSVVGALAAWWFRDLPRREAERALEDRLRADVRLGGLQVDGTRRFVLRDLVVRRIAAYPSIESVTVERLVAEGGVREILRGRFELLDLDGVELRLAPPPAGTPVEPAGPTEELTVARLVLGRGRVVVAASGEETSLDFEADATGIGGAPAGTLRARAERLGLGPLAGLLRQDAGVRGSVGAVDVRASLAASGEMEAALTTGDGNVEFRDRSIAVPPATLAVFASRERGTGRIAAHARLDTPLATEITAAGTWDPAVRSLRGADLRIVGARLSALATLLPGLPEGTAVEGVADLTASQQDDENIGWTLSLERARLETPGAVAAELVDVRGAGTVPAGDPRAGGPIRLEATVAQAWGAIDGVAIPSGLVPLVASFEGTVSARDRVRAHGAARATARSLGNLEAEGSVDLAGASVDARWRWSDTTVPALEALARDATGVGLPEGTTAHGRIEAEGTVRGPLAAPAVAATVVVRGLQGAADLEGFGRVTLADGELTGGLSTPALGSIVEVRALSLRGTARAGELDPVDLSLQATGRWSPSPMWAEATGLSIVAGDLGRIEGEGRWGTEESPRARGKIALDGVGLARIQAFLRPWIGDPFPGFSIQGSAAATVTGSLAGDDTWEAEGTAVVRKSGFASDDGSKVLEGFDSSWELDFEGSLAGDARVHGTAEVGGFLALWETFFADYSGLPSAAEVRGSFRPVSGESPAEWDGSLNWDWPGGGIVRCELSSRVDGALGYGVSLRADDLTSSLDRYLRGPLGDTVPWFERIEGSGALDARVEGVVADEKTTARGRVRLEGLGLAGTKGLVEVEGLDLDLPFDLAFDSAGPGDAPRVSGGTGTGSLSFERLHLSGLDVDAVRTGLTVDADSVALEEPLAVPMLGGGLGFERLRLEDALRPSRRVVTALLVHAIDLNELARAFDLPPLEGTADGYFPRIELTGPTLEVDGGGGVDLFGGRIDIGNISGRDLLTRFPKIELSLEFRGIDLERVTRVFDFGSMTGILNGSARNVELFRGVPTRFDARIESVDRGRERIDVKAINNIAILGTGGRVSAFDRGIHKFLDTFYYEKLGMTLQLVNDVFLMRGLEERGGKELFLKGALPFRIDIVNVKPGQTTSFRSMLERMKSVDFKVGTRAP